MCAAREALFFYLFKACISLCLRDPLIFFVDISYGLM